MFHAAGPGHGKAVVASYMISNEVALRRGLAISALAALMQAVVAVLVISTLGALFNATAQRLMAATEILEFSSYIAIIALGLALVWRKGRAGRRQPAAGTGRIAPADQRRRGYLVRTTRPFAVGRKQPLSWPTMGRRTCTMRIAGTCTCPTSAALSAPGFD